MVSNLHRDEIKNDNQHYFVEKIIMKPRDLMQLSLAWLSPTSIPNQTKRFSSTTRKGVLVCQDKKTKPWPC